MLLTTQLQNQNPLDPLDTNQFTQQLVQFAQVEQQIKQSDQLAAPLNLQKTAQATQALQGAWALQASALEGAGYEQQVVETVAELPESITSTLRRHKSTTLQLTHIRIKPTSSQLLLLLWQPLPL
mgnify:CR=1 FL=1